MAYEKECANLLQFRVEGNAPLHEIVFFLTNRCNQRCLICWQWEDDFKSKGKELSDEKWIQLLQDAIKIGAQHFYIVGGGEPMVRGDLVIKLAEIAKQKDMFCVLHTNGTLFKQQQMDRLIYLNWDQIIFSIDGPNPEINDYIRGKGTFDKAFQNLLYFHKHRKAGKNPIPDLGINFTITNKNYSFLENMVELAMETGCGGIHATFVQPFNERSKQFVLNNKELDACKDLLISAKQKAEGAGLYHTFDALIQGLCKMNPKDGYKEKKYSSMKNLKIVSFVETYCFEPFLSMAISADGKVSPCCMFWEEDNPSLHENSLLDIWQGTFFKEIRTQLQNCSDEIPDICRRCPSQLRQRSENIRKEIKTIGDKTTTNPFLLLARFFYRMQKEGISSAWRRVKEWLYIRLGKI